MKFQGDIASLPLADVVQNLATNRKSGLLTVQLENQTRWITLDAGRIVCYNDDIGFSVLEWFEEKGIIDPPSTLEKCLKKYRRAKRKSFGAILSETGLITLDDYKAHVKGLLRDMVCETLSYREGLFEFNENAVNDESYNREFVDSDLALSANSVLMEAARRFDEWISIRNSLPSENDIYRVNPAEAEKIRQEFADDEVIQEAVSLLDGTRSIREVISLIPFGRFHASRALAQLVSLQKARPVDGNELVNQVDQEDSPDNNSRNIVKLKAALEREPGNQVVLEKLAELCQGEKRLEESATYRKHLALKYLGEGQPDKAELELRFAIQLNEKDISAWQKLYEILEGADDPERLLTFGRDYSQTLRRLGFNELARDLLAQLTARFHDEVELRLEYADTLFTLGDKSGAVENLLALANERLKSGDEAGAEQALSKVIEYDNHHEQAREIFEKVRTGALEKAREARRRMIRTAASILITIGICSFIGYDLHARREFTLSVREVIAQGDLEAREYRDAVTKLQKVSERHPYSLIQLMEVPQILRRLESKLELPPPAVEEKDESDESGPSGESTSDD